MTDTDYDRFMDAVSSQFEQHLQRLFPDDYGLQRIAWDAWDDFRRTKEYDGPVVLGQSDGPMTKRPKRDPNGRVIDLAKLDPAEARELHDALVAAFDALGDDDTPKFSPQADDYYGDIPDDVIAEAQRRKRETDEASGRQWVNVAGLVLDEDEDPVRTAVRNEALAKFSGRKGLRAYMSDEAIRRVEEYRGPVVLGQPALRVGGRVIKPLPGKGVMRKSKDISAEEFAAFGLDINEETGR